MATISGNQRVLTIVFCVFVSFTFVNAWVSNSHGYHRLSGGLQSSRSRYHHEVIDDKGIKVPGLGMVGSRPDIQRMRHLLHLANIGTNTVIGSVLAHGEIPKVVYDVLYKIQGLSIRGILDEMLESVESPVNPRWKEKTDKWPWMPTDNQSECTKDFSRFVDPITNRLWKLIWDGICQKVGPLLCNAIPQPTITKMPRGGLKMIDAMGKIPEGISEVKLHWVGAYDMCNAVKVYYNDTVEGPERQFTGRYCRVNLTPSYDALKNLTGNASISLPLQLGVCVPDTCNNEGVMQYIMEDNKFLSGFLQIILNDMKVTSVYCGMELEPSSDTALQVTVTVILCCVVLILIGTIYDGCFRKRNLEKHFEGIIKKYRITKQIKADDSSDFTSESQLKNDKHIRETDQSNQLSEKTSDEDSTIMNVSQEANRSHRLPLLSERPSFVNRLELFIVGFSAYSNLRNIFSTQSKPGHIPVLNGIRYMSYAWTILGNTYFFGPIYHESFVTANTLSAMRKLPKSFKFQAIINFHLSTDSFFLISGILLTYWFLKKFDANGRSLTGWTVFVYIFHRYWRLVPTLMMTIMFYTSTYRYFAEGPLFPANIGDADNCRVNWWVDLLMVHNLVRLEHMCIAWMFCLPIIFQIHVVALLVVIPLVLWPVVGYCMLGIMYAAHIITTAVLTNEYRSNEDFEMVIKGYFFTPWCRAGPVIIGMVLGILLYHQKRLKMHWLVVLIGWIVSLSTMAAVIFSTYSEFKDGGEQWTASAHAAYDTLARSAWAAAVGWIVLACHYGYGGIIGWFLSWKLFWPLSRLVLVSLFTHPIMIFRYIYTNRLLLYINDYHMFYLTLGNLIYTMIMGLVFGLLWHYPLSIGFEKAVSCRNKLDWMRAGRHPHVITELDNVVRCPSCHAQEETTEKSCNVLSPPQ